MKQVAAVLMLACVAAAGGGCESWASRGQSNLLIEGVDAQRLGYAPGWASSIALSGGQRVRSVALLDDLLVFVEEPGNFVTALSARDGKLRWRRLVGSSTDVLYGPYRVGNEVCVNSETQFFKIDAKTGDLLELQQLDHAVRAGAAVTDELAVFGGADGRVFAHQIIAGYAKWKYDLTQQIRVSPVLTTVDVFAADAGGVYAMLQVETGTLAWRSRTHGAVNGQPVVNRFSVLVPCDDGSLYALDRSTGRDQWIYRTRQQLRTTPIALDAQVFLLMDHGTVALDAQNGREMWTRPDGAKPILRRDDQLLLSKGRSIVIASLDTGVTIDEAATRPLRTIVQGPDDSILLISTRGDVQQLVRRR
jgi:outer membrane protein assembly factor BamB